jgi:6-phosphogluconolactonase
MNDNWISFHNKKSLFEELKYEILDIAKKSITEKGHFSIVLTGGKSILYLYKKLSDADSNFDKWHVYLSDERFLPKDHQERNDRIISKIWLNNNRIPKKNIHFIQAELGLDKARKKYEEKLDMVGTFDIVLLSIGDDGHISSLFPEHIYNNFQSVVIEKNSPKPPKERISISYQRLNNTKNLFKVIIGESKRPIVRRLLKGERLPANFINGEMEKFFIHKNLIIKK